MLQKAQPVSDGYVPTNQKKQLLHLLQTKELQDKIDETKSRESQSNWEEQTETEVADEEMIFGKESAEEDGFDLTQLEEEASTLDFLSSSDTSRLSRFL